MILSTLWVAPEAECSWFFVPLFLLGAAIRVWAAGCAGEHTRTRSDRVPRLVTHGPYAIVRNPLYVANLMLVASALAAAGFRIMAVVATLVFGVVYQFVVRYEEENLRARFGDRYDAYRRRTPRWIPRQWPSFRPLPLREGLWRERFNARTYVVFVLAQVARETLLR
jgi:protein-S-isoprenylcysteine O-methyltransferase Ste14